LADGKTKIKLSDFGEKPILLVFAEFWSEPCMKQLNVIENFRKDNPMIDIEIIPVSSEDRPEELERYRQFWKEEKFGYELGWAEIGLVTYFMDLNGFRAIPQASFIRNEKILFSNTGYYPAGTDSFLSDIIRELNK
jgi:thiol-disulfide isomerase/thioredoxin